MTPSPGYFEWQVGRKSLAQAVSGKSTVTSVVPLPISADLQILFRLDAGLRIELTFFTDWDSLGVDGAVAVGVDNRFGERRRLRAVGLGDLAPNRPLSSDKLSGPNLR